MSELVDHAVALLTFTGWQEVVAIVVVSGARFLGLTYGFIIFAWTMPGARVVRVAFSIALGLPAILTNIDVVFYLVTAASIVDLVLMILIEIILGFALGFLISLPFIALPAAGAITDTFRGEADSGHPSPTGGTISSFGVLYVIIAFLVFANNDGLFLIVKILYQSYIVWPINSFDFSFERSEITLFLSFLGDATALTLRLCLPLLAALFAVEYSTAIAARLAKRYNIYNLDFLFKNLVVIILLPMVAIYGINFSNHHIMEIFFKFDLVNFVK